MRLSLVSDGRSVLSTTVGDPVSGRLSRRVFSASPRSGQNWVPWWFSRVAHRLLPPCVAVDLTEVDTDADAGVVAGVEDGSSYHCCDVVRAVRSS